MPWRSSRLKAGPLGSSSGTPGSPKSQVGTAQQSRSRAAREGAKPRGDQRVTRAWRRADRCAARGACSGLVDPRWTGRAGTPPVRRARSRLAQRNGTRGCSSPTMGVASIASQRSSNVRYTLRKSVVARGSPSSSCVRSGAVCQRPPWTGAPMRERRRSGAVIGPGARVLRDAPPELAVDQRHDAVGGPGVGDVAARTSPGTAPRAPASSCAWRSGWRACRSRRAR